jgi:isoleucyl-tRNA synthetase
VPLSELTIAGADARSLADFVDLIGDEVNVKNVTLSDDLDAFAVRTLKPNGRVLGPRLGKAMQEVLAAARAGQWAANADGTVEVAGQTLVPDEFEIALEPRGEGAIGGLASGDAVVVLDIELTPALVNEGHARQLSRYIQDSRRQAGLQVTDRVHLTIDADDTVQAWLHPHLDHLRSQVLASSLGFGAVSEGNGSFELDGHSVRIGLTVAG